MHPGTFCALAAYFVAMGVGFYNIAAVVGYEAGVAYGILLTIGFAVMIHKDR